MMEQPEAEEIKSLKQWQTQVVGTVHLAPEQLATLITLPIATNQDSQLFRVAAVTTMERSAALVTTVTGGVLLRTIPITPTAGACTTITAMSSDSATLRR